MKFVLVSGAWAGAWLWDEVAECLRRKGHEVHAPTLAGLDDTSEPAAVGLRDHVENVESYIRDRGLESVVLVGHSYAGIVVGQVASRSGATVRHTIFVEAFLPVPGKSLLDVSGLPIEEEKQAISNNQGMWPAPSREELEAQPKLDEAQINLLVSRQKPHPGNTILEPAELESPLSEISASFIAHEGWLSSSLEQGLIQELKASSSWQFRAIDGGHWPMLSMPQELSEQIHSCVSGGSL